MIFAVEPDRIHNYHFYLGAGLLCFGAATEGISNQPPDDPPEPVTPLWGFGPGIPWGIAAPGGKQVTRPLGATRSCAGQGPVVNPALEFGSEIGVPCTWTANSLPSAFPAVATVSPGIS